MFLKQRVMVEHRIGYKEKAAQNQQTQQFVNETKPTFEPAFTKYLSSNANMLRLDHLTPLPHWFILQASYLNILGTIIWGCLTSNVSCFPSNWSFRGSKFHKSVWNSHSMNTSGELKATSFPKMIKCRILDFTHRKFYWELLTPQNSKSDLNAVHLPRLITPQESLSSSTISKLSVVLLFTMFNWLYWIFWAEEKVYRPMITLKFHQKVFVVLLCIWKS